MRRLIERYRLPESFLKYSCSLDPATPQGFFTLGEGAVCFGSCSGDKLAASVDDGLCDVRDRVRFHGDTLHLPFDPDQLVDNLLLEHYPANAPDPVMQAMYYGLRPLLPDTARTLFQRFYLRGWERIRFPRWPVDTSVERILEGCLKLLMKAQGLDTLPFIWFWPDAYDSCAIVTHDVESARGRDFCSTLMDLDDSYGIKSSFQIIPESRYSVSAEFLADIRDRGFEINVHDLKHDGTLFLFQSKFAQQVAAINRYGEQFKALGFRAGAMYRNQRWYQGLNFEYDMSVPNVAHLEPQRGGCCTVFPYSVGKLVELPLTITQDYALFHFLKEFSPELWQQQIDLIRQNHGLISILVHPDYITKKRPQEVYLQLLRHLSELRDHQNVWTALPGDVNRWWRTRNNLRLVHDGSRWTIQGAGSERARIAFACLKGDSVTYRLEGVESVAGSRQPADGSVESALGSRAVDVKDELLPAANCPLPAVVRRKPLNVCMVAYTYYDGDNRVMRYAETLAARGDHVDVIALRRRDSEPDTVIKGVNVIKIQSRTRNENGRGAYLFRLLAFLLRSAWIVAKRHHHLHYDLIHVHSVPDFLVLAALLPKFSGTKIILDIHDVLPEFYASKFSSGRRTAIFKLLLLVERASAWVANHVIIANDIWRERLVARSVRGDKCTTILNFPDRGIFHRTGKTREGGRFVMLYPGTLSWHQGLDIAIRALARIRDSAPQAELHIYGQGTERQSLIDLVRELNLDGRVQIHDSVSLREIAGIMEDADLAVVPKRGDMFGNEAFSTKTLEFMALGVPLIVAATAIDKYYFDDSLVRFFRCGDEEDLAAAMLQLITDSALRRQLVQNGLAFASLNDWESKQGMYLDIVNSLCPREQQAAGSKQQAAGSRQSAVSTELLL